MNSPITIEIDGKKIKTSAGRNLVDVATEANIFLPSLCYYPHIDPPLGTCRVCTCKVDGQTRAACITSTYDGMQVEVNTAELEDIRRAIVEMMFSEGNHFCPACEKSGNCDLQHMGYEMGITHTRFPHLFKDRLIDFSPKRMLIDHNRCIKCRRCVEEVFTDDGLQVFSYCNKGNETLVGIDYEQEAKLNETQAIEAMQLCPTGAILIKGKSLPRPFGDRRFDMKSVIKDAPEEIQALNMIDSKKSKARKIIATTSLAGCFGCHMSMLDMDLVLLDLIQLVDFNKSPLTDIKQFTEQCDVGLIEGGCCNAENIEVLQEFRKKCKVLVSVGECAIWGGVPAMRNTIPLEECLEEAYLNSITTAPGDANVPYHDDLPKLLDRVYPCREIVEIDYHIPGCPPSANHIWKVVSQILWDDDYSILYSEFKYD